MLNINNANDSIMVGMTRFAKWKRNFDAQFRKPQIEAVKMAAWGSLPQEAREYIRELDPDAYKTMQNKYGG